MTRTVTRKRAGARKPHFSSVLIRESYAGSTGMRVDRAAGVIYHVKVLGKSSPNTHGKSGVTGTDYLPSAHQSLVSLIESAPGGLKVNKNHTERNNQNRDRTIDERFGWLVNPVAEGNETFADLHLLKDDPASAKLFEAAERNPYLFALSINADGHYQVVGNRLTIDRFNRVHSVDTVADGGTNISLAESKEPPMKLREALENLVGKKEKALVRLFEMDSLLKPDAPAEMPEGDDPDFATHLGKAVVAILNDDSMDQDAKKKKILAILKLTGDEEETSAPSAEPGEETVQESDESDADDKDKKKDEKEMKESREVAKLKAENNVLRMFESHDYHPTKEAAPDVIAALVALPTDKARITLIESLKGGSKGKPAANKGTGPPRSGWMSVKESGAPTLPKDAKEQASLLLSRN
jgi:hypothetical protein